jgi:HK97 gp10 family phage protein
MIKFKLEGMQKAIRELDKWEENKKLKIANQFNSSAMAIVKGAKMKAPVNQGRLRSDIQSDITRSKMGTVVSAGVFNTVAYAPYVEFGTKGKVNVPEELQDYAKTFQGKTGGTFDQLLENIGDWAKKKGIDEGLVFPIARKIAREGVKPQPYLFPAFEEERPKLIKKLEEILNERT